MQAHAADAGVFIRSMATRGHLGGLARATGDAALVLDAAGKDIVIIETVGVGQDEVDIIRTADVSIVTLVPGTGDEVQALKAGIMEIADIFVVNKADREGADRLVSSVEANLALHTYASGRVAAADREDRGDDRRRACRAGRGDRAVPRALAARAGGRGAGRAASTGCASWCRSGSWITSSAQVLGAGRARRDRRPHRRARGRSVHRGRTMLLARAAIAESPMTSRQSMKAVLDHVGIAVKDLGAALAFYRDALGLEVEAPKRSRRSACARISSGRRVEARTARGDRARFADRQLHREARPGPAPHHAAGRRHRRRAGAAQGARRAADRRAAAAGRRRRAGRVHPSVERARRAGRAEAVASRQSAASASVHPELRSRRSRVSASRSATSS